MAITQIKSTGIANGAVTSENLGTLSNISVSGTSNLGNVGNVTITGGSVGQVLTTDGTGNLSWAAPAATVPTITQIQITDSSYNVIDDTAVSTSGGYIKITGTNFSAGAIVVVGNINAISTTFVSSTVLNVQVASAVAGTYTVYVVNTNGTTAIRVNGLTYSGSPTWVTGSTLTGASGSAYSQQLTATGDAPITYALQAGSTLPSGLTLTSGGLLSGTVTVGSATTYTFTVVASDAELQDSPRTFNLTFNVYDFDISPAVGGISQWTFSVNGNLSLTTAGEYTLTFASNANKVVKMWGSGGMPSTGGVEGWGNGGAGGAATGNVSFVSGSTYKIRVPAAGGTGTAPALAYGAGNGGGTFSCGAAGSGGGYAGIFLGTVTQANAVLMAGGGGGGASSRSDCRGGRTGGAGGGTNGQSIDSLHGTGGTQSAGGTGAQGGGNGSALQGGNGTGGGSGAGGGYYGGGGGGSHGDGGSGSGGGSGYFNPSLVSAATLYTGSGTTPGNNSDSDRGSAGTSGTPGSTPGNGKILIIA